MKICFIELLYCSLQSFDIMKMKKVLLIYGLILVSTLCVSGQDQFQANTGGGTLQMDGGDDQYFPGYRFHAGLSIEGRIPIADDLTWELGVVPAFGRTKFYIVERGNHSGINGPFNVVVFHLHSALMLMGFNKRILFRESHFSPSEILLPVFLLTLESICDEYVQSLFYNFDDAGCRYNLCPG